MNKILGFLNQEQTQAVTNNSRFTQIVAGPGTGKTTTLAAKILYVQTELGIDTDKILGISFSRSAKEQLLNKLEEFTGILGYGGRPTILTFHSLAHRIIKHGIHFNESRFRNDFQRIAVEKFIDLDPTIIKGLCPEYADRTLVNNVLSQAYTLIRQGNQLEAAPMKNWDEIPPNTLYHIKTFDHGRVIIKGIDLIKFWKRIIKLEKIKNVTDFQGLITEANRLLSLKKLTYQRLSESYEYIFVDEYQDTSLAQEKLLFLLNNSHHSVTVVGDKKQTIYTFNGSNSENLDRFLQFSRQKSPFNTEEIRLTRNYRSTREIIEIANHFMNDNGISPVEDRTGILPEIIETHSIKLASEYTAKKIRDLIKNTDISLSDICILYRKNSEYSPQADAIIEQLEKYNIPYNQQKLDQRKAKSLLEQVLKLRELYEDEPLSEVILKLQIKNGDKELIDFIKEALDQGAYDTDDLSDYLVELEEENYTQTEDADCLSIKTVHQAKGQEFPIVFILYLGDREFPHSSHPNIDEEKRLFYVGLTRAENQLYVIGQRGIEFEGFLDNCLTTNTNHITYHSSNLEEKNNGFNAEDKNIIDETTRQLNEEDKKQQEELKKLMDLF
ncbi:ATP-dependent helicase [Guptibacillus hwajinpoensis]|uniref:ATP-dependent helicase n=1 Tax=Guptibacillus hwajinpoensis TaxID=208199 RepID=UPI003CFF8788